MATDSDAVRDLLRDSFTRLIEHVDSITDDLSDDVLYYQPSDDANSIAWLLWHSARVQDAQLSDVAGVEPLWTRDGWADRFSLDLPRDSSGYGHTPEEAAKVARARRPAGRVLPCRAPVDPGVRRLGNARRARAHRGQALDSAVTASARIVSIIDDCAQHLGSAAYLKGIAG